MLFNRISSSKTNIGRKRRQKLTACNTLQASACAIDPRPCLA